MAPFTFATALLCGGRKRIKREKSREERMNGTLYVYNACTCQCKHNSDNRINREVSIFYNLVNLLIM